MKKTIYDKTLQAVDILAKEMNVVKEHTSQNTEQKTYNEFTVEIPRDISFGDYSTNAAFILSKKWSKSPEEIAKKLKKILAKDNIFNKVEIAGKGFINFSLNKNFLIDKVKQILNLKSDYGKNNLGNGQTILLEYVSANPTGPLHVGNGRGGIIGDVLNKVLSFSNYKVNCEYYVNDAESGNQVENLTKSIIFRMQQLNSKFKVQNSKLTIDDDFYKGDYVMDIAKEVKENNINDFQQVKKFALNKMLSSQKEQLKSFGVDFDNFFSEQSLYDNQEIEQVINSCKEKKLTYEKDGALWVALTKLGSKKDEVLVRANGIPTYFAADIAYHINKFKRGYNILINIWGADHHGHIERIKMTLNALGYDAGKLKIILYQLVHILREGTPLKLSKREGEIVTLEEVVKDVGKDAARFFFLMMDYSNTLEFDLEVAKKKSMDNPVYYVQYAYCRINSILEKIPAEEKENYELRITNYELRNLKLNDDELLLIKKLLTFPDEVEFVVKNFAVYRLCNYAKELASVFHSFYHTSRIIGEKKEVSQLRLLLVLTTKIVLENLFYLMDITPLEKM